MKARKIVIELLMFCVLIVLFFSSGCAVRFTPLSEVTSNGKIPKDVKEFFESSRFDKAKGFASPDEIRSIVEGTHKDLYMPKLGKIRSKSKKWTADVKFKPSLYYENEGYILVKVSSGFQLASFTYMHAVIRKSDGKIIRRLKTEQNIIERMVEDDIFYFKIIGAGDTIYCMKIGE